MTTLPRLRLTVVEQDIHMRTRRTARNLILKNGFRARTILRVYAEQRNRTIY